MSPSSMSSWAGVWLCVTLDPSKWKRTFLRALQDILDRYWEKTGPSGASWNNKMTRLWLAATEDTKRTTEKRSRYEPCAERTPVKRLGLCSAGAQWWRRCRQRLLCSDRRRPWRRTLHRKETSFTYWLRFSAVWSVTSENHNIL